MAVGHGGLPGAGEEWKRDSLEGKSVLSWARKVKSGSGARERLGLPDSLGEVN